MAGIFEVQKAAAPLCPNLSGGMLNWDQHRTGKWLNTVRMGSEMFRHRAFLVSEVAGKKCRPERTKKHLNWRHESVDADCSEGERYI